MSNDAEQSRLEQVRKSTRSRVSRSMTQGGLALDLVPAVAEVRGRYGRFVLVAAALVALVVAAGFVIRPIDGPRPAVGEPVAFLELARGSVGMLPAAETRDQSRLLALQPGSAIHAGQTIETGAGRAALRLAGGGSMRLDVDSRVRVASASQVALDRGAVYFDSAGRGSGVEVRTTLGMVREVGTQFEVRLLDGEMPALRVRVREGMIVLRHGQTSHQAAAGEELAVRDDGVLTRAGVPVYGPLWQWVLDAAPVPEIEGRDLRAFLDWFTHEGGWRLRFADAQLAESASTIMLHGDAAGLGAKEAAVMALRGSGLAYRVEGDELVVTAAAGQGPAEAR